MLFPYSFSPWLIRKIIKSGTTVQKMVMKFEKVYHVSDQWISLVHYGSSSRFPLRIRVYMPQGEGPFPIVVFFHGGGWVICDVDTHDEICRHISIKANCVVVSVDYRLAPEYKFPIPVEDAYSTAVYICEHAASFKGDASRVCLSGDSAGGNLSIVCAQLSKKRNGPSFFCLATIYPSVDLRSDCNYASYDGKNIGMNKEDSDWFLRHYFIMNEDRFDPRASPIITEDLRDQPPMLIITGEHDRIRDPAEIYGNRLQMAGVRVTLKRYSEVGHGFLSVGAPATAKQALDFMANWIVNTFNGIPIPNTQPDSPPIPDLVNGPAEGIPAQVSTISPPTSQIIFPGSTQQISTLPSQNVSTSDPTLEQPTSLEQPSSHQQPVSSFAQLSSTQPSSSNQSSPCNQSSTSPIDQPVIINA